MNFFADTQHETPLVSAALPPGDGPVTQAVALGFRALLLAVAVLALAWVFSGVRQVPPDARAVTFRFGAITGVAGPGLVWAWPPPAGKIVMVPGADALLRLPVPALRPAAGLSDGFSDMTAATTSGADVLTPDGVVLLDATLTYRVTDPGAYVLAAAHVPAALARATRAAAAAAASGHALDDFLAFRADVAPGITGRAETAEIIRAGLLAGINDRLSALDGAAALGVAVTRLDLTAALPPAAKSAFDAVAIAGQVADQAIAGARRDAALQRQQADRNADALLSLARAKAAEHIARAETEAMGAAALAATPALRDPATRPGALADLYRRRLAPVMARIGEVIAVDPSGAAHLIVPGGATPGR